MNIKIKDTCLHFLDNPGKMEFNLPDDTENLNEIERQVFGRSFAKAFSYIAPELKKNIRYLCQPFMSAYKKARPKLVDLIFDQEIDEAGTFITHGPEFTNTIFYYVKTIGKGEEFRYEMVLCQFSKHKDNNHYSLDAFVSEAEDSRKTFFWSGFKDLQGDGISKFESELLAVITFLRVCELETKIVEPKKRQRHVGHRYENNTNHKIEIIDSTWFTTIVRSEGFSVGADTGGFFRLQPWGPQNSKRKLIWVMPFEKQGYIRKAKMLKDGEHDSA